jgi:hypothetical protein
MQRIPVILALATVAACNGEIYLRDGVTDGDTFYLADRALSDPDPVVQSWVRYSLGKSTCQLQIGGDNPARATSFDCELTARRLLLEAWAEYRLADPGLADSYLDSLSGVEAAGFLPEYVAHYHGHGGWQLPGDLDPDGFLSWRRRNLRGHGPQTRLIGSWNYARNVRTPFPAGDGR